MTSRRTDFFISHAGRDSAWAEWLAWQLQELGYTVELDVWDWAPGDPHGCWPAEMQLVQVARSRDSQPAGCRFDSYAAHQFPQATALLANGGSSQS